jgi:O-antigen ligase
MGRGAIAVTLILAFFCFLSLPRKLNYLKNAFDAALHPIGLMLLIMALLWIPNITLSSDSVHSLQTGLRTFLFLGVATLFWSVLVQNKALHGFFCRAFVIASLVTIFIALIAELAVPELYWFFKFKGWQDIPIGTAQKSFAALAVLMVPALLWAGFRLKRGWAILAATSSIGFITLVGLTYNRAAIAGFIAMILVAAALVAYSNRSRIIQIALPLLALAIFIGTMVWLNTTRQRPGFEGDWFLPLWLVDFPRQSIWRFSFDLVQQHFWFGMGINTINFAPGADAIIPRSIDNLRMIPSHPHNWILEVFVETGVFGILSLLVVIAGSFVHMISGFLKKGDNAYLIAICIFVGYWVSGLFNFSFWSAWWQMSFLLITALCLSQKSDTNLSNYENVSPNS